MLSSVFPMLPFSNKKNLSSEKPPGGHLKFYKAFVRYCQNLLFYQSGIRTRVQIHHSN